MSLADVAAAADVSRATASLVLRDSPLVARDTRERVRQAVDRLGYIYNRGAANLRAARTKIIGLLVCELVNPFFAELTVSIDEALDAAGYVAFLANTSESIDRQWRFLQRMREQNVDGVVLCPAAGTGPELIDQIRGWGIPCVQALRYVRGPASDYTGADYSRGVQGAVEYLIGLGHRRIAFVGGIMNHSAARDRRHGFTVAMRRHGLAADLILPTPLTRGAGANAVDALLDRPDAPTAAVCFNDIVAFGVMLGLDHRGLRPGSNFAVVGMDDVPEARLSRPGLTTVSTLPRQVGVEAAALLLRRIADPLGPPERIILPAELVIRGSSGPPPPLART